ncbi:unnamed protein product [Cuscuta europaea]|uniref:Aminotransferase-like plant mobile domain-containing protein n=1 Tax=Cuscuta europaea TaxID=41803 RepID=A0A9P0ZNH4_CUSEU|nr:unnamed protein product [Cuscuta europaea]
MPISKRKLQILCQFRTSILLGLPIDGMPLSGPTANTNAAWIHMCTELAGFTHHESDLERGVKIKCRAITRTPIRPDNIEEEVTQHARVVVWQLLGGLLFPNTSGDKIRLYFLELLNGDLADARRWSWGSAVLGFLYHNLCKGNKWNARQIGGCLHLLQLWAWERLPMLRPQLLRPINLGALPMDRTSFIFEGRKTCVARFTRPLRPHEGESICMDPYPLGNLPKDIRNQSRRWFAEIMLIFCDYAERHYPDRFCRQFFAIQREPNPTLQGACHHTISSRASTASLALWAERDMNLYELTWPPLDGRNVADGYRTWYARTGWKRVVNPSHATPRTGYTPAIRELGVKLQCIHDTYQLADNLVDHEDIKDRLAQCVIALDVEEVLHHGIFHYPDADYEPDPMPRPRQDHRGYVAPHIETAAAGDEDEYEEYEEDEDEDDN